MVTGGRGVTVRLLLALWLAVTALAYLVIRLWTAWDNALPPASWASLIFLVFIACGVFFAGLPVRRFLRGKARKPLNPIRAMRTLVLAQASALTGALVTGWYVAQVLVLLPDADVDSVRALVWKLAALAAGGVLMMVSGCVVQAMCRVDRGDGPDSERTDKKQDDSAGNDSYGR
jgi:signal transduction histidine kinase